MDDHTVNVDAFSEFVKAMDRYLISNGWVKVSHGRYEAPVSLGMNYKDIYFLVDAVKLQQDFDRVRLGA